MPAAAADRETDSHKELMRGTLAAANGASVCLVVAKHFDDRQQNDLDVEHRRPMPQVIQIVIHARFHLFEFRSLAAASIDLGKTGDARQYLVAHHVAFDELS